MVHLKSTLFLLIMVCQFSCNDKKPKQSDIWAETVWTYLDNESIAFRKPNHFKKSSKFRLKEDLSSIANDSIKLTFIQNALDNLEFNDSEVDVYVDTTSNFHFVVLCNMERVNFGSNAIKSIKKSLNNQFKSIEALNNNKILYTDVEAISKENNSHKMARFATNAVNIESNSLIHQKIFYLTGDAYTLIVFEFSDSEDSIEKYLWSTKIR